MIRYKLGNVFFEILLCLKTHVAQFCIAHRVVPLQHFVRVINLGMTRDPRREFFIGCSRRDNVLELFRGDAGEREPLTGQRTGSVIVLAIHAQ